MIYFFISYQRKNKENQNDIDFIIPEDNNKIPKCIYMDEVYDNQMFTYNKIFKVNKSTEKGNKYYFEFEIEDDKYIISFDSKGKTFVYEINLEKGKKIIPIKRKINQNILEYYEKMHIFIDSLKENNEENKIDELYKDTIDLYTVKTGFAFLIELFIEIYKKKDLCSKLMEKFKEMNRIHKKDDKTNMDRKKYLEKYISTFDIIQSEAGNLIEQYEYKNIEFYEIILSYLNFYNKNNFSLIVDYLFKKKPNYLYEILLIYNFHFKNPINQNFEFFNKFIKYTILNKEFSFFERGLSYIRDIETFLNIIEKNKEDIFNKYIKDNKDYLNNK